MDHPDVSRFRRSSRIQIRSARSSMEGNKHTKEEHSSYFSEVPKTGYSSGGAFILFVTQISIALAVVASALYCGYLFGEGIPVPKEPLGTATNLAYALRCLFPLVVVQFFFIFRLANMRLTTKAANPLSGNDHLVQLWKNIATNTLEQLVMFSVGLLSLSTLLETQQELCFIPVLCVLFIAARVLFAIGYSIQPRYRVIGMCMNFLLLFFIIGAHVKFFYERGLLWKLELH